MKQDLMTYAAAHREELLSLLAALCAIPAPSHHEERRAAFCKARLEAMGAKGVYIDKANNVVFPYGCEESREITVIAAHTDTVFPDTAPMPYEDDGARIRCPGVGDDTANVAVLLMTAGYLLERGIIPKGGILFVCNACEEGLGNLKGCRQIFADYAGRIKQFVSFDGYFHTLSDRCVGSHRYEVTVTTNGGHSWKCFGEKNAITVLSRIINRLYDIEVPQIGNSRTTYNVGTIEGGTSVNTIAQSATMLCEYRSDSADCLAVMEARFRDIFREAQEEGVCLSVRRVGERPCMGAVDATAMARMRETVTGVVCEAVGITPTAVASSTDCNIPFSLGIPAVMIGACDGGGAHTREEWLCKDTFHLGLAVGIGVALRLTDTDPCL